MSARDLSHMPKEEFDAFIKAYKDAMGKANCYPCNEAQEQAWRRFASLIWDAGKSFTADLF